MTPTPPKTRVDWDAARAFYVALGPEHRTYPRVASHFTVSVTTVKRWAKRQDWARVAADADNRAADKVLAAADRSLEQRNRDTVRVAEKVRSTILDEAAVLDPNVALRVLPRLSTLEQLIAGQATGRIEVSEVTTVLSAFYVVTGKFVPEAARSQWLAELDSALGGLVELDPGDDEVAA